MSHKEKHKFWSLKLQTSSREMFSWHLEKSKDKKCIDTFNPFPSIFEDSGGGGGGESFYGNGWLVKGEGQDRNNKFANRVRSIETFFLYNLGHFKLFNWIHIATLSDFCRTFSRSSCRIHEYFRLTKQHLSNWWKIFQEYD